MEKEAANLIIAASFYFKGSEFYGFCFDGTGISPFMPKFKIVIIPVELFVIYQTPVDGRKTAKSVLPSPS